MSNNRGAALENVGGFSAVPSLFRVSSSLGQTYVGL